MIERPTIALTSPNPALLAALQRMRPEVDGVVIDEFPDDSLAGPLWCFVDWLLPASSGLEMCRRLRALEPTANAHITLILEKDDHDARRRALRAGADDYLVGPLTAREVLQRIDAATGRQIATMSRRRLQHGSLTLDQDAYQVRLAGIIVPLRPNEFHLLTHFLEYPDQVFSRLELIRVLGRTPGKIDERTVDAWIGRLRRALIQHGGTDPIRTVREIGYVLDSIADE